MSGAGARDHQGDGLYHGDPTAGFNNPFDHGVDVDSFFFHGRSLPCAAGDGYSSISDPASGVDVKQEMAVVQAGVSGHHDGHHQLAGGGSSSVLSSSSEAIGGEEPWRGITPNKKSLVGDDEQRSTTDLNRKSTEEKKKAAVAPQPRVAFMTKSQVDHLEDGYRWRKYGQKAVKNSSFPRSYYRCTAARCGVKKLVERSQQDPSSVITTYEGQHTHPSPVVGVGRAAGSFSSQTLFHQLGRLVRPDDLARMGIAYAHGGSGSPAAAAAAGTPPPPMRRLLPQEGMRDRV